ncbi:MAG: hypothetical protein ABIR37_03465 [Candidatus Saccharimonadales bacterium]
MKQFPEQIDIGAHQANVLAAFPEAADHLHYNSPYPEGLGIITISRLSPERQEALEDGREKLESAFLDTIPARYERYAADLTFLQKRNPDAALLGVTFDATAQTLTAPPIRLPERYIAIPPIGGSMGRRMSSSESAVSDVTATIRKVPIGISAENTLENFYILELTRHNLQYSNNYFIPNYFEEGSTLLKVGIDEALRTAYVSTAFGPANYKNLEFVQRGHDAFQKAFRDIEAR